MHIIGRNFSFKKTIVLFLFLSFCAVLSAQTIKYVSFFPTPHVYYSSINANIALLGTRGEVNVPQNISPSGRIEIGHVSNEDSDNVLTVDTSFYARNLHIKLNGEDGQTNGAANVDLRVGYYTNGYGSDPTPTSPPTPAGILNVFNRNYGLGIGHSNSSLNNIKAYDNLSVKSLYWDGYGGFGLKKNGTTSNWGTDTNSCNATTSNASTVLQWKALHISGTDSMQTYLVCCDGSGGC
ncbi:MAG: hypothetical protein LBG46_00820 [Elusimicrobiota bacterium]|jgi:hypothetical protein|nr:hypothetical protein [Elusimicrobiota bacterium]